MNNKKKGWCRLHGICLAPSGQAFTQASYAANAGSFVQPQRACIEKPWWACFREPRQAGFGVRRSTKDGGRRTDVQAAVGTGNDKRKETCLRVCGQFMLKDQKV